MPSPSTPLTTARSLGRSSLDDALVPGAIVSAYQPIVDLESGATVAVEALARGPRESPDALFASAREQGRIAELDRVCQEAAVAGARRARLRAPLFLNVEPQSVHTDALDLLARTAAIADGTLPLVLEITERALTARPAELIDFLARARSAGWRIALDDVGSDPRSLAFLPVVRPDIVKLDASLVRGRPNAVVAELVTAIAAECERTGAAVVAEGIETERHRLRALAMGATLGQGWLFGRPGPLGAGMSSTWRPPRVPELHRVADSATPFSLVTRHRQPRRASWRYLLEISAMLERQAATQGRAGLVVAAFQSADRFTELTRVRYRELAANAAFVAALGVGMPAEPEPGVRGARLGADDPLRGEWSVVVLGPHFAGALVAQEIDEPGPRPDFIHAVTYERNQVVRAATALLLQVARLD